MIKSIRYRISLDLKESLKYAGSITITLIILLALLEWITSPNLLTGDLLKKHFLVLPFLGLLAFSSLLPFHWLTRKSSFRNQVLLAFLLDTLWLCILGTCACTLMFGALQSETSLIADSYLRTIMVMAIPYLIWQNTKVSKPTKHIGQEVINPDTIPETSKPKSVLINELNVIPDNLIIAKAYGNYVQLWQIQDDQLAKKLVRSTFNEVVNKAWPSNIQRTHRSYLVNTDYIKCAHRHGKEIKLTLSPGEKMTIPVSRTYKSRFKKYL